MATNQGYLGDPYENSINISDQNQGRPNHSIVNQNNTLPHYSLTNDSTIEYEHRTTSLPQPNHNGWKNYEIGQATQITSSSTIDNSNINTNNTHSANEPYTQQITTHTATHDDKNEIDIPAEPIADIVEDILAADDAANKDNSPRSQDWTKTEIFVLIGYPAFILLIQFAHQGILFHLHYFEVWNGIPHEEEEHKYLYVDAWPLFIGFIFVVLSLMIIFCHYCVRSRTSQTFRAFVAASIILPSVVLYTIQMIVFLFKDTQIYLDLYICNMTDNGSNSTTAFPVNTPADYKDAIQRIYLWIEVSAVVIVLRIPYWMILNKEIQTTRRHSKEKKLNIKQNQVMQSIHERFSEGPRDSRTLWHKAVWAKQEINSVEAQHQFTLKSLKQISKRKFQMNMKIIVSLSFYILTESLDSFSFLNDFVEFGQKFACDETMTLVILSIMASNSLLVNILNFCLFMDPGVITSITKVGIVFVSNVPFAVIRSILLADGTYTALAGTSTLYVLFTIKEFIVIILALVELVLELCINDKKERKSKRQ